MRTVLLTSLLMVVVILSGCQEQQVIWGQGDPPADWQDMFGNDNIARLDFVQTNTINKQQGILYGTKDPNSLGAIRAIVALESRIESIGQLLTEFRTINAQQHRKLGETDIRFHDRLKQSEEYGFRIKELESGNGYDVIRGVEGIRDGKVILDGFVDTSGVDPSGHSQGTCLVDHTRLDERLGESD